jgi:hypothetical protein
VPLSFDSTGFQRTDQTSWFLPATGDHVLLEYFDLVPDLPAALTDLPKLRHELTVIHGESGCLIEAHVVDFAGVPALLRLEKLPLPDQQAGQGFKQLPTGEWTTQNRHWRVSVPAPPAVAHWPTTGAVNA